MLLSKVLKNDAVLEQVQGFFKVECFLLTSKMCDVSLFSTVTLNEVLLWGEKSTFNKEAKVRNLSSR